MYMEYKTALRSKLRAEKALPAID
ncbi:hypothetical protein CSHISOI_07458 [Colletotrichum shisoi]|uniref:Uncharacterized protein n=1 Tax=Colletotrichum shisoi TaxID=2078593 RepID=A0A5Q4BMQ4_9PEZI|nr:hypothetical protein CSHISOI_07458 [Colletotrichum shisoi]